VLQELLNLLQNQQNNFHTTGLKWIVIILIVVEVGDPPFSPWSHALAVHLHVWFWMTAVDGGLVMVW
jgi:hypothetical protein